MSDLNESDRAVAAGANLIRNLMKVSAFPHSAAGLNMIETHISWVILAGDFAYKIKKPVNPGFLDFSTLALRHHYCDEELRLNRRFAPSIYLDVVPIGGSIAHPCVEREPAIEWAVRMHRFPAGAELDRQISADRVSGEDMHRFGATLANIHAHAEISTDPKYGSCDSIVGPALDNFVSLDKDGPATPEFRNRLQQLRQWTLKESRSLSTRFIERVADGRIRECHGDLHLGNLVRLNGDCIAFDCLEFDPALRWIDVLSDVGFLAMDLLRFERPDLACGFLNRYLEISNDYSGLTVLPCYIVYRALVRAKTTALRMQQQSREQDLKTLLAYVDLADRIAAPTGRPLLVICHGLSGSGKTWLSDRLIAALPAIRIRSDIVRKHLYGLAEHDRSQSELNADLYDSDATLRTYEQVASNAGLVLLAGFDAIVDATCLRRADRQRFMQIADEAGAVAVILNCTADRETLETRIRDRHALAVDASEADIAVLHAQLSMEESLSTAELEHTVTVNTARNPVTGDVARALRSSAGTSSGAT